MFKEGGRKERVKGGVQGKEEERKKKGREEEKEGEGRRDDQAADNIKKVTRY